MYIYITSISDVNRKLNFFQDVSAYVFIVSVYLSICMACSYFALGKLKGQVVLLVALSKNAIESSEKIFRSSTW